MEHGALLLSVRPTYANLLVEGLKSIELRRKFPTELKPGTKCYVYASSPVKRVIGEIKIDKVDRLPISELWSEVATSAMVSWLDFAEYFAGLDVGHAVHVYGACRYEKPLSLSELESSVVRPPQSYCYLRNGRFAEGP